MAPGKSKVSISGVAEGKKLAAIPTGDELSPEQRVHALLEGALASDIYKGWGSELFNHSLNLVSASSSPGSTAFSYTVLPEHTNRLGNLHGGCIATIFDICTTTALAPIAKPGFWAFAGVSRTLNVTYIRPVAEGESVIIESEVVHAGKRLCMLKGVMKRKTGEVLATCEHGKVSIDPEAGKL